MDGAQAAAVTGVPRGAALWSRSCVAPVGAAVCMASSLRSESFVSGDYQASHGAVGGHMGGPGRAPKVIYDGKRMRKPVVRKSIDFNPTVVRYLQVNKRFRIGFVMPAPPIRFDTVFNVQRSGAHSI